MHCLAFHIVLRLSKVKLILLYRPSSNISDNLLITHMFIFSRNSLLHSHCCFKGVLHLWALFLKTLCIFSKNKATSDKVSYGSGQKCSKELENYSFTSVETIVVKLQ